MPNNWVKEFGGAITVCDDQGIILEMNDQAIRSFKGNLVGKSLFDCHPEAAGSKLRELMDKRQVNIYTIEKKRDKETDLSISLVSRRQIHGIHGNCSYNSRRYASFHQGKRIEKRISWDCPPQYIYCRYVFR